MVGIDYQMNSAEKSRLKSILSTVREYDIKYVNKGTSIKDIGLDFKRFRAKRKDKFNILVIDNAMKLTEHIQHPSQPVVADNMIAAEIDSWNLKTSNENACVFLLHHLRKDDLKPDLIKSGLRPKVGDIRGSGRFTDSFTQILLVNYLSWYTDIVKLYSKFAINTIKRLLLIDLVKNRNGPNDLMRYIVYPEYSGFMTFEKLINLYKNKK
jgi:hypothetical protein